MSTPREWPTHPLVAVALDDGTNLVEHLIAEQWAAPWDGRGTPPVPVWPRTVAEPA